MVVFVVAFFFFFNDTATTEIYTLSLHDALPICEDADVQGPDARRVALAGRAGRRIIAGDRKSTRLNSSHSQISYAVFCLKKKKRKQPHIDASVIYKTSDWTCSSRRITAPRATII